MGDSIIEDGYILIKALHVEEELTFAKILLVSFFIDVLQCQRTIYQLASDFIGHCCGKGLKSTMCAHLIIVSQSSIGDILYQCLSHDVIHLWDADHVDAEDNMEGVLYNIMTRDYLFNDGASGASENDLDIMKCKQIETSSFAVIHGIDGVLLYDKAQFEEYRKKLELKQQELKK